MSSQTVKPANDISELHPLCPCGGYTEYFGEALMGELKCKICGAFLTGVGFHFLETIEKRWNSGERGFFERNNSNVKLRRCDDE